MFGFCDSKAAWMAINKPGVVSWDTFLMLSLIMLVGVGGEAGDMVSKYKAR